MMDVTRAPEVLVTISMRFPNLDPRALAEQVAPVMTEALKAGGLGVHLSTQPYDPDEGEDG